MVNATATRQLPTATIKKTTSPKAVTTTTYYDHDGTPVGANAKSIVARQTKYYKTSADIDNPEIRPHSTVTERMAPVPPPRASSTKIKAPDMREYGLGHLYPNSTKAELTGKILAKVSEQTSPEAAVA